MTLDDLNNQTDARPTEIDQDRDWTAWFAARVDINSSDCWVWRFGKTQDGYGRTNHYRRGTSTSWRVHRLIWTALRGPIPDGLTVDHLCFNRACCNLSHLRLMSNEDNAARQIKSLLPFCSRGHKFTPENTVMRRDGAKWRRRCGECLAESEQRRQRPSRVALGGAS